MIIYKIVCVEANNITSLHFNNANIIQQEPYIIIHA